MKVIVKVILKAYDSLLMLSSDNLVCSTLKRKGLYFIRRKVGQSRCRNKMQ